MTPIRLLIVDDSRSMRMRIGAALAAERDIQVVGEAADPLQAREAIKALNPDVVTLDVEMPHMNGLDFLERLMRLRPMPVVMVSSLTGPGCDAAVQALEIGAVDCIAKPVPGDMAPFGDLADKIRTAASARLGSRLGRPAPVRAAATAPYRWDGRVIAMGSSTGGVEALSTVLASFPAGCPPTVITQHMPPKFTASFAKRLDGLCGGQVTEAFDGAVLEPGRVYLAPGGDAHLTITGPAARPTCRLVRAEPVNGHRPAVDVLFSSVAKIAGKASVGVVLTGMGRDGAQGLAAMRQAGAVTIGQDEASSLIYGMPRAAFEAGAVSRQLALADIGPALIAKTNKTTDPTRCP